MPKPFAARTVYRLPAVTVVDSLVSAVTADGEKETGANVISRTAVYGQTSGKTLAAGRPDNIGGKPVIIMYIISIIKSVKRREERK